MGQGEGGDGGWSRREREVVMREAEEREWEVGGGFMNLAGGMKYGFVE